MMIITCLQEKRKERQYLDALKQYGKARIEFLESVNEILKFKEMACFKGFPDIVPVCSHFKQDSKCIRITCPLHPLNNICVNAFDNFNKLRRDLYRAETAMVAAKVKE